MTIDLSAAAEFIWRHARLLDRHRFAKNADGTVTALLAYQNSDGGFGNALEPDCRAVPSQPVATEWAFEVFDEVGRLVHSAVHEAADWLGTVLTEEGGIPFCLPTVDGWPRAPWWNPEGDPNPPNVTPTAGIAALLRKSGLDISWVDAAEGWCWGWAESAARISQYDAPRLAGLYEQTPHNDRAQNVFDKIVELTKAGEIVPLEVETSATGPDTHTPLRLAPTPSHPLRCAFSDGIIESFLDRLEREQREDGGWPIDWPAPGETATGNWRAIRTIQALRTLDAYGRISSPIESATRT
jgi:hypothetical protein